MTRAMVVLALTLAACEKVDTSKLEKNDEEILERIGDVSAGQARMANRSDELAKRIDIISQELVALEAKLDQQVAARPTPSPTPSRPRRVEPDPKDVYAIPIAGNPVDGPADALVTIVEGYEYACPYCEKVRTTLDQLRQDYPDDVRIVHKQFVVHPQIATAPALAACAANMQGKFAKLNPLLWEKAFAVRKFDAAHLEELAKEAKLDLSRYRKDIAGDCPAKIQQDQADLQKAGQGATPTFFINGHYLSGAQPLAAFKAVIDAELRQARDRVAAGTRRRDYYQEWVLDRGLAKFTPAPVPTTPPSTNPFTP